MIEKNKPEIVSEEKLINQEPKKEKGIVGHTLSIIREIIAIIFWIYVISKLFIFDIDIYFTQKIAPNYVWLLDYKFFILIGIIALVWLVTKNKHIISWSLFIIFYPAIIVLWKIPIFIFKQKSWTIAFAYINVFISFFKSIKYNFVITALFLISVAMIFGFSNPIILWSSIFAILIVLSIIYINRFILIFKPSNAFQVYIKILSLLKTNIRKSSNLKENVNNQSLEKLTEEQLQKWVNNLQSDVLMNRVFLFTAKRLKDYQNKRFNIISYVFIIMIIICLTIFSFAVINLALFKIEPNMFAVSVQPTFFTFIYYSFNIIIFSSIQDITPIYSVSQFFSMVESFFALFLIAIFISLLISVRSQKHTEELNIVIKEIEEQGIEIESFIKIKFNIESVEEAMAMLDKLKAVLSKFLFKMSESIK